MKKVFLEELPKFVRGRGIDWRNCIGLKIQFIYDETEGYVEVLEYIKDNQTLVIKYLDEIFKIKTCCFRKCRLGNILNKSNKLFNIKIGETIIDEKRNLTIIDMEYRDNKRYYKYHCNKCGAELWVKERSLKYGGTGCGGCSKTIKKCIKGINDISTTNPEMIPYFVNINDVYTHTNNSNCKALLRCLDCGFKKEMRIDILFYNGFSCPKCGDGFSYPNKFMFNLLEQLKVEFKSEYSPEWIKPKRYDFYIDSVKLIIEMDGGFHNKYNNLNGQTKEQSKEIDNYKDKLAEEHGLKVIRIDCDYGKEDRFVFIKNNIINSKLNEIFDLNNIDWNGINILSQKSKLIEVCKYWKLHNNINNENITVDDLENFFKISKDTIIRYLKKGMELGLCTYDFESKVGKNSKRIEVFKNNVSLGIFESCTYVEKHSEELFGVKLIHGGISLVTTGRISKYKGYTFKYV